MPTFHNIELFEQFPSYIKEAESVPLHKAYSGFLQDRKNKYHQYDFLQWCLHTYKERDLQFKKEDFSLIIEYSDCQHVNQEGSNSLALALLLGNARTTPLTTAHFSTLLHGCDFVAKSAPILGDSFGLVHMFVYSQSTLFSPTSEEIQKVLEGVVRQSKEHVIPARGNWNALHYAFYYGKMGQGALTKQHLDYLLDNFQYDLSSLNLEEGTKHTIIHRKTQYDILKEKNSLENAIGQIKSGKISKTNNQSTLKI